MKKVKKAQPWAFLFGGFNPSEKYEFVSCSDYEQPQYWMGKSLNKIHGSKMFQSTNQVR